MNNYIKHIVEAFDFNNINNQKKSVNVYDVLLQNIREKIRGYEKLTDEDYKLLKSSVGIYKVSGRTKLKELIEYFIKQFGNECTLNWIDVSNITDMAFYLRLILMVIYLNGMFLMSLIWMRCFLALILILILVSGMFLMSFL